MKGKNRNFICREKNNKIYFNPFYYPSCCSIVAYMLNFWVPPQSAGQTNWIAISLKAKCIFSLGKLYSKLFLSKIFPVAYVPGCDIVVESVYKENDVVVLLA